MKLRSGIIIGSIVMGVAILFAGLLLLLLQPRVSESPVEPRFENEEEVAEKKEVPIKTPAESYVLPQATFVAQTFNNCGPASLSMILSLLGKEVGQDVLASEMRPFNNPSGGIDDKSIFVDEFVTHAEKYGFKALHRPNGTVEELRYLVANDLPVVVRTWLNPVEDIGHFRVVRGYNNTSRTILVDDSYNGPNLSIPYEDFESMWKPFNYGYILIYPSEKQELVEAILGENFDERTAWRKSLENAEKELSQQSGSSYAMFNASVAYYHLGDYQKSVELYEKAAPLLPGRMLWYQLEPIQAYLKLHNYERVFALTSTILNNGNAAYSELYQMRGEAYLAQGNKDAARAEFEKAVYYNKNFLQAQEALKNI